MIDDFESVLNAAEPEHRGMMAAAYALGAAHAYARADRQRHRTIGRLADKLKTMEQSADRVRRELIDIRNAADRGDVIAARDLLVSLIDFTAPEDIPF